jgi:hypothetical protein
VSERKQRLCNVPRTEKRETSRMMTVFHSEYEPDTLEYKSDALPLELT